MVGYNTQQLNINNPLSAMALMVIVVMFFRLVNKMLFPGEQELLPQTEKYLTILDPGDTTFKESEVVSPEAYEGENRRVKKLGLRAAFGKHLGDMAPPTKYLPATVHPTLQKYRDLAKKHPEQVDKLIDRAKHEKSSLVLGRGFSEPFEDYLQRRLDVKARWDALVQAIEELQSGKPGLMPATSQESEHEARKLVERIEDPVIRRLAWDTYQEQGLAGLRQMLKEYHDYLKRGEQWR